MKSRGWKISLLVLSALAITACGQKKKNKPTSQFQGIWIERSSARAVAVRGPNGSCAVAVHKSFIIHGNGEVFTYIPDARLNATDGRDYFLGGINAASVFAPMDNRRQVSAGFYAYGDLEATGLTQNSQLVRDGNYLIANSYGQQRIFVQINEETARRLWTASAFCSERARGGHVHGGVVQGGVAVVPVQPGVIPGYDPRLQQGQGQSPQQGLDTDQLPPK